MAKNPPSPWPPPRDKWPFKCKPAKGGWVRWYKGRTRWVCSDQVPLDEIEDHWTAKKRLIDDGEAAPRVRLIDGPTLYRDALSEFLAVQQARVGAVRNRIEDRTYHNYAIALNDFGAFVHEGTKIADRPIGSIGPAQFSAYARRFAGWKASGFDSVVCRIGSFFRWCVEMEYLDRYRPGPQFVRPAKKDLRDDRISLAKSFTPTQIATLYLAAGPTMRCWIALGVCAAFNNSDIAHLTRDVIDLGAGLIDFRRRKTGKVRRVIPLPADVVELLKDYDRPDPAAREYAALFFLTERGYPCAMAVKRKGTAAKWPSNTISRLFAKLLTKLEMKEQSDGRNFSGLRTSFFNLAPRGEWEMERKIVMGRAQGSVDLDSYLEDVGLDRLRHVVNHVWGLVSSEINRLRQDAGDVANAGDESENTAGTAPGGEPPTTAP